MPTHETVSDPGNELGDGELTAAERLTVLAALDAKMPDPRCEMCGHNDFALNSWVVTPTFIQPSPSLWAPAPQIIHPSLHLACTHCGNTKLISLFRLGVSLKGGKRDG